MISYIRNKDIDKIKWDQCIEDSSSPLIYARFDFLQSISENWDALIMDNYEQVMPITWNRKYTIYYLYQPFFCASLGIFGNNINGRTVKEFLEHIPRRFRFWDIYLNHSNYFYLEDYTFDKRLNFTLDLTNSFETLRKSFSKNHIKNISTAIKSGIKLDREIPLKDIIHLAKRQAKSFSPIRSVHYRRFVKLYQILAAEKNAFTYGAYNKKNELLASAVFLFSFGRAYYILVGNHPKGRNSGASHYLMNEFIKDHSEKKLILDFEGSNIESIARFYKGFGGKEEIYPGLKMNRLPKLLQFLRK